jgi:hypothetical protein
MGQFLSVAAQAEGSQVFKILGSGLVLPHRQA